MNDSTEHDTYDLKTKEELDKVFDSLSDTCRIRTLLLLRDGVSIQEIAKTVDRTRAGVYDNINRFKIAGLTDSDMNLTERGQMVCSELNKFVFDLDKTLDEFLNREAEERLKKATKIHQARFGSSVTQKELEKMSKNLEVNLDKK